LGDPEQSPGVGPADLLPIVLAAWSFIFRANSTTSRLSVTPSMPGWVSEDIGEVAGIGEVIPMTVTSTNSV
jgi:hypothetical protein